MGFFSKRDKLVTLRYICLEGQGINAAKRDTLDALSEYGIQEDDVRINRRDNDRNFRIIEFSFIPNEQLNKRSKRKKFVQKLRNFTGNHLSFFVDDGNF